MFTVYISEHFWSFKICSKFPIQFLKTSPKYIQSFIKLRSKYAPALIFFQKSILSEICSKLLQIYQKCSDLKIKYLWKFIKVPQDFSRNVLVISLFVLQNFLSKMFRNIRWISFKVKYLPKFIKFLKIFQKVSS